MSEEPKKWKRGDIGPDGRVFWGYYRKTKEQWVSPENFEKKNKSRLEADRRNYEINREKLIKKSTERQKRNRERTRKNSISCYKKNIEKNRKRFRLRAVKKTFLKADGSTLESWRNSFNGANFSRHVAAIQALEPDHGQSLAELIHELSGYSMEVCEQIANPPEPDTDQEPKPAQEQEPKPFAGPDLF